MCFQLQFIPVMTKQPLLQSSVSFDQTEINFSFLIINVEQLLLNISVKTVIRFFRIQVQENSMYLKQKSL